MKKSGLNLAAVERLRHDWEDPQRLTGLSFASVNESENPIYKVQSRDRLTGLYDRGAMDNYLELFLHRGKPFAVVFADLNSFGRFNKGGQHAKGDMVLRQAATMFAELINHEHDTVATLGRGASASEFAGEELRTKGGRWGGDEFLGLIDLSDVDTAEERRKILDNIVTDLHAAGENNEFSYAVGYAVADEIGKYDASTLLAEADAMMFADKPHQRQQ